METTGKVGAGHFAWFWRFKYWIVLTLIVVSYVLCAYQVTPNLSAVTLLVQLVTVAAILQVTEVPPLVLRVAHIVLSVAAAASIVVWFAGLQGRGLYVVLSGSAMLAYFVAPVAILRHQFTRPKIDVQTLLAAISAYVLVGMFFTFLYNFIALVTPTPIFGPGTEDTLTSQLFFSFSTLTTTGYGNLVPSGETVQSIAIAEAITGQLFLVIAVARVVTGWVPRSRARPE
ncbi:two pore domain potassium channel family protein [Glaciibacter psychrotolerans]|uniref:Potassium channel domain-containing protein n=1 Tax=Glaciibacter psychrotolerans TaxID=670054 RepID=A0A7Z0EDG6_9MICO|nr:two pore domain potassium channel family protein [Leifsonia psychrotolerans]NYJ19593.1 hypothetical protein [Leifsonia psychrotolerans]